MAPIASDLKDAAAAADAYAYFWTNLGCWLPMDCSNKLFSASENSYQIVMAFSYLDRSTEQG